MIVILENYQGDVSRAFTIADRDNAPDIISIAGSYWIWSNSEPDENDDDVDIYQRATRLEIDPL